MKNIEKHISNYIFSAQALPGYVSVTQAVWLHKPFGYTGRLVAQAVWLHKPASGYTGFRLVTQAAVWLHRRPSGYTSRCLLTQAAVWLHRPPSAYTGCLVT